jgi:hypothetical protein
LRRTIASAGLPSDKVYLEHWGTWGSGPGQFNDPFDVAIHGGDLYIADGGNHRVQRFDASPAIAVESQAWGRIKTRYARN